MKDGSSVAAVDGQQMIDPVVAQLALDELQKATGEYPSQVLMNEKGYLS